MKYIFILLTGCACLCLTTTQAQVCDSLSGFQFERPELNVTQGFGSSDVLTCVTIGQQSEIIIPFITYLTVNTSSGIDTVSQVSFGTPTNLPCGLCWGMNKVIHTYDPGESGCFLIRGIATGATGQYILNIPISISLTNGNIINTTVNSIGGVTDKIILRVISSEDYVQSVNYTSAGISSQCN